MSKILITGSAGFIGSHLYAKLKNDGHEVVGIDNWFHACNHPITTEVKRGDILNIELIDGLVKWSDTVFHLAAQIHVDRSILYPYETAEINIIGTLNILEAVRKYNKQMVFASSSEIYGSSQEEFMNERHPLDAQSPYAASKVAGDRLCKSYNDTYKSKVAILRNFNTFGPYQADTSYGGVIAIFVKNALLGKPLNIFGSGEQERDYMSVLDAIKGYELCVEKELWGKPINISTGKTIKIKTLAEIIKNITKSKSEIVNVEPRAGEVQRLCGDNSFARSLGFVSETDFERDLNEYINWYKKDKKI